MNETITEPEAIEHLDFQPPCEGKFCSDPPRNADWVVLRPCGCELLICGPCLQRAREVWNSWNRERRLDYRCRLCGTGSDGVFPIVEVRPL